MSLRDDLSRRAESLERRLKEQSAAAEGAREAEEAVRRENVKMAAEVRRLQHEVEEVSQAKTLGFNLTYNILH